MTELGWDAWYTVAVVVALVVILVKEYLRPDMAMMAALGAILAAGVLEPADAFAGFSNPAVLTVASLFIVAAGVSRTGAIDFMDAWMTPRRAGVRATIGRVMMPAAFLSAFLNNTPIVAMLIPRVQAVAERVGISSSRLLIPLSYAAIAGGMTTLIGTSTNLLASGFLVQNGYEGFHMFEFAWIGIPAACAVIIYLMVFGPRLLPDRSAGSETPGDVRDYLFELRVPAGSSLVGRTIVDAELRSLKSGFLVHVRRQNVIVQAAPSEILREEDVLAFSGDPDLIDRLLKRDGLDRVMNGYEGFHMFEFAWIGIPAACAVIIYLMVFGPRLLPDRSAGSETPGDVRDYLFELRVPAGSSLVGRTIVDAELRSLKSGFLVHVRRQNVIVQAAPSEILREEDVLAFSGDPDLIDRLLKRDGLDRVMNGVDRPSIDHQLMQFDAVVSANSGLIGRTLKEVEFRETYQGVVLAIHRRDEQIAGGLGSVPLRAGDLLLIEALPGFDRRHNQSGGDFYLVVPRKVVDEPVSERAPLAIILFAAMIVLSAIGVIPLVSAAFIAALLTIATKCLRLSDARRSIDFTVLLTMAAALGVGQAVAASGLANAIGLSMVGLGGYLGLLGVLIALYLCTVLLTEIMSNAAAVILMLPIALSAAGELGVDPHGFAIVVTIAASASFLVPIGYQTNLMVMSVAGYRLADYLRAGIGVSAIVMIITITVVNWLWL